MNNKAVRVPSYATYYVINGTMKIVVELTARLSNKGKCSISENDCSEHVSKHVLIIKLSINIYLISAYKLQLLF